MRLGNVATETPSGTIAGQADPGAAAGARSGRHWLKTVLLWAAVALTSVIIAAVVVGLVAFDDALEHPEDGGFSGWQCDTTCMP